METPRDKLIENPSHWRIRAAETRALAKHAADLSERRIINNIAHEYDRLAEKAEARRK